MTVGEWLKRAEAKLKAAGIGSARLDALILLEDVITGLDRAKLLAEPETVLLASQRAKLKKLLNRRAQHEPIAYIRGFTEFYGRRFVITPAVLEPRPESETMIELLLELKRSAVGAKKGWDSSLRWNDSVRIADVGTGSGALGITAKLELPNAEIELLDIDPAALQVAKTNVDIFTLKLVIRHSDLLSNSPQDYDILLCNLPYVPDNYHINEAASQEPSLAIFGGPDGLDVYRKLFSHVAKLTKPPLYILTESLPPQHERLQAIAESAGYQLSQTTDFIQVFNQILIS